MCLCTLSTFSHSPSYQLIPIFFSLYLSKITKQCLVENNAQLQKLYFANQPGTAFIFYFYRGILWISLLIMKIDVFTLQDKMRRTWHWTEVGSNEHNQLYHTSNYISLYSWYIEIYHMQSSFPLSKAITICKALKSNTWTKRISKAIQDQSKSAKRSINYWLLQSKIQGLRLR